MKRIKALEESVEWLIKHEVVAGGAMRDQPESVQKIVEKIHQKEKEHNGNSSMDNRNL